MDGKKLNTLIYKLPQSAHTDFPFKITSVFGSIM